MDENLIYDSFKKSDNNTQNTKALTRTNTGVTAKFTKNTEEMGINDNNQPQQSAMNDSATKKLTLVCCVCSVFMLIEFFGGLLSDSIAIMTDAAHLLSDLTGFLISIYALNISGKKPDAYFTFGYYRAEIVGAVSSVFIIWILTALLLVESITRLFDPHHYVNGKIMLITSSIGLVFNGVMAYVLHSGGEGGHHHHHCHGHDHEQGHSLLRKEEHHHHHDHGIHGKCSHHHEHNSEHEHDHVHDHDHDHSHDHKHDHDHDHKHDYNCNHEHNHDHNIKNKKGEAINQNVIIEEPNEENESSNSHTKSKNSAPKKYVEMNEINNIREHCISQTPQYDQIKRNSNNLLDSCEETNKKKESLVLKRNIGSGFDRIEKDNSAKKRKSEIINLKTRKLLYNLDYGSPHVSRQLTRDHSKLHKLDLFIGLKEQDEDDNCSHNSDGCHSESLYTISFHDVPKTNANHNQDSMPSTTLSHSHNHSQHNHNINVQAAFIHIIGDIIQSIGVIIASSLIYFFPSYQIIDPLTTILFSVIVITTTVPIIKQCIYAIMEGNTNAEDFTMIKNELLNTPGVISVGCFHLYYLSLDKAVLCAHIKVIQSVNECDLLKRVYDELDKYKLYHCTIEISKEDSNTCNNMMEIV